MKRIALPLAIVLFSAAAPAATAGVLVVDDDGGVGVDHTTVMAALGAATSGDTILVREGNYGGGFGIYTIDATSLDILAEEGQQVVLRSPIRVSNLLPDQVVRLRGLTVQTTTFIIPFGPSLVVQNSDGQVWVEHCSLIGTEISTKSDGTGVSVFNSEGVTFSHCELLGGGTSSAGLPAPKGLVATDSNVYLFESDVVGGDGLDTVNTGTFPTDGGPGAIVSGGFLYAQRSSFAGGAGGDGGEGLFGCFDGDVGGAGVLLNEGAVVRFLNSTAAGGPGGAAPRGACVGGLPGAPGADVDDAGGSFFEFAGSGTSFCVGGPVREGDSLDITVAGDPGDALWLWLSAGPDPLFLPVYASPILLDLGSLSVIPLGSIPPGGELAFSVPIGELGPGIEILTFYLQIASLSATHGASAGSGQGVTLLDAAL